ncbi:MAG: hypothetical protein K8T25_08195, partial [Planctomycetia bacterium]|nr:hypothetical protein [Planctomycetia bacterium]
MQQFHSRAVLADGHSECATIGRARHLDSWLMDAATCREVFAHGTPDGGLGLVEGAFEPGSGRTPLRSECLTPRDSVWPASTTDACARLETLCRWLDLPRLVVLDAALLNVCHLPSLPADTNGLLLIGLENVTAAARLETQLSALWGVPVLGWLDRAAMSKYSSGIRNSGSIEAAYWQAMLADSLERSLKIDALIRLTTARRWPDVLLRLFRQRTIDRSPCIAIAHDEVFDGYFQETLDLLELHGARLEVFSPLRDEALPAGTDVVYIGGGGVEQHAAALAENTCMTLALRE